MKLVREFRINSLVAVSEAFSVLPGTVAGVTVSAVQANLQNGLVIRWGDVNGFRTQSVEARPAGFNGSGYCWGGPCAGEIFGIEWGPGADVYLGTVRFWDEPIAPFGQVPILLDSSTTLAPAATSAVVTGHPIGAWLGKYGFHYIASEASTVEDRLTDGTIAPVVWEVLATPNQGVGFPLSPLFTVLANDLQMRITNNGLSNMTYFARWMGYCGG